MPHTHTHARTCVRSLICAHMPLQAEDSNCSLLLFVPGDYTSCPVGFFYLTHSTANYSSIKLPCGCASAFPAPLYTRLSAHVHRTNAKSGHPQIADLYPSLVMPTLQACSGWDVDTENMQECKASCPRMNKTHFSSGNKSVLAT